MCKFNLPEVQVRWKTTNKLTNNFNESCQAEFELVTGNWVTICLIAATGAHSLLQKIRQVWKFVLGFGFLSRFLDLFQMF